MADQGAITGAEGTQREAATATTGGLAAAAASGTAGIVAGAFVGGVVGFLVGTLLGMTIGESAGFWHAKGTKKAMLFKRKSGM
jgi:hypothetical protein